MHPASYLAPTGRPCANVLQEIIFLCFWRTSQHTTCTQCLGVRELGTTRDCAAQDTSPQSTHSTSRSVRVLLIHTHNIIDSVNGAKQISWLARKCLNPSRNTGPCYNNISVGNRLYAEGRNRTNTICCTCKKCRYKCAGQCEHSVIQRGTEHFWWYSVFTSRHNKHHCYIMYPTGEHCWDTTSMCINVLYSFVRTTFL